MEVVVFTISIVVAFMVAWKAVDFLAPYHAGKAALFAMAMALIGPPIIEFTLALLAEGADEPMLTSVLSYRPLVIIAGSKMACALLAVLAWCGGEAVLRA